ncbi:MAG TPA: hypothetical protein VGM17_02255 [Rhizomicrobium sp.]|jgi:hypothetical protein
MLHLDLNAEPFWLEVLPGQRTQFRPITTKTILVARNAGALAAKADPEHAEEASSEAFTRSCAQQGIVAWEGVGDTSDNPLPVTPEAIAAYLSNWRIYDAIDKRYVIPALVRGDEKNAFAPSQSGTTGAKIPAKGSADTAPSASRRKRTAKSAPTA